MSQPARVKLAATPTPPWLAAALDYVPRWLEHQMRITELPGCAVAIALHGEVVFERAFGYADLAARRRLTPRHRFRVASHSKCFTAVAVLKLCEQGRLRLDDRIGSFVNGLHPDVAEATLRQLLSHSAGLTRDGQDGGQWTDRRPFLDAAEVLADLADGPVIEPLSRLKYSNHGYGLVGMAIEAVTGERYVDWVAREVVAASGLRQTAPDMPTARATPFARGHSAKWPLGRRVVVPADNPTHALAAATGFVSTAGDLARFFASLAADAPSSLLQPRSRREITQGLWPEEHSSLARGYGLGTFSGRLDDWDWYGHTGGFQGTITRTAHASAPGLTVSVLTNAADGAAYAWVDGVLQILRGHARHGAPAAANAAWCGRWWTLWGAFDLLPVGEARVLVAAPSLGNPLADATELVVEPRRRGQRVAEARIALAGSFASHGERARLLFDDAGLPAELWLGATRLVPEAKAARELARRYGN